MKVVDSPETFLIWFANFEPCKQHRDHNVDPLMCQSVGWLIDPPLWSRLKYLNNYWMDFVHSWSPEDETYWSWWSPGLSCSAILRSNFSFVLWNGSTQWTGTASCSLMMNPNNFGDALIFSPSPSWGQHFNLSSIFNYDQIPGKLMEFPWASAILCVWY